MAFEQVSVAERDENKNIYAGKALGDKLVPLVDGPEIFGAIGKAIGKAEKHIYLTAWLLHLDVKMGSQSLRQLLLARAKAGVKVRIILCDLDIVMGKVGKNLANIETQLADKFRKQDSSHNIQVLVSPMKDLAWKGQVLQTIATKYGNRPVLLGSHHQKTLVIDGKVGFCSGCDITFDVSNPDKWHDASIMIQGEGVHGLEQNFVERWNEEGKGIFEKLSISANAKPSSTCKIIRTMPSWWFDATQIKDHYLETIRGAKKTIYMENQYLRHPEIGTALEKAARRGVKITIILPRLPEEAPTGKQKIDLATRIGIYAQYRVLKPLAQCTNISILSPAKRTPYIHAKLLIADTQVTLLGSANANCRSMNAKADSEINVLVNNSKFASELLVKLKQRATKWKLEKHDVENEEVISRLRADEPDFKRVHGAKSFFDAFHTRYPLSWPGSWILTNLVGVGGIMSAENPDELRDGILDALLDYL